MTTPGRASLSILKPMKGSVPRAGVRPRKQKIDALENELAVITARGGSPELAKLVTNQLTIEKGALRKRERLQKQYRDPAWADPRHGEPRPRASLGGLLKSSPSTEIEVNNSPKKSGTASLGILRASGKSTTDDGTDKQDARALIKSLHAQGGVALHLPQRLRKGPKK